ncbi:MAG: hypothetical protein HXS41_12430 [Theionarchaea archaeon]|nr:hypothetical protein [Theionarchaea archaeon]MBU7002016.1 hypothetical protein [Theionarchaea archaeon]MBU7021859.1 hypothetical protein [Theionarchaea archaeon]
MNIKREHIGALLLIVALTTASVVVAFPESDGTPEGKGPGHGGFAGGCWDQLTEEQREALEQLVQEMNDSGASPEEIRDAVQQYLEEQGIDIESCCCCSQH